MILFADTSVIAKLYVEDEAHAEWAAGIVFDAPDPIVVSEIVDVEIANVLYRARRDGRIDSSGLSERLDAYGDHTADDGPIGVAPLRNDTLVRARRVVLATEVNTLDAIHVAAAQLLDESTEDDVTFLTLDMQQGAAAQQIGLWLYPIPRGAG